MVDSKENYKLDLGVQGWNKEIYDTIFTFSQKVSLTKKTTSPDLVDETGPTFFPFFFLASLLISYKPKWNDIKKVILVHRVDKVHKESYIHKYHLSEKTTQVNSAFHARWFIHWEVISKYYSLPSRQRDKINFQLFFIIILTEIN